MILVDWYSKCVGTVNWNGIFSTKFSLICGVRQGGCLSPVMFSVLVDCLIWAIHQSGLGCYIDNINFGILMYADDLVLLSASVHHLQLMINICLEELKDLDLIIIIIIIIMNFYSPVSNTRCHSIGHKMRIARIKIRVDSPGRWERA